MRKTEIIFRLLGKLTDWQAAVGVRDWWATSKMRMCKSMDVAKL